MWRISDMWRILHFLLYHCNGLPCRRPYGINFLFAACNPSGDIKHLAINKDFCLTVWINFWGSSSLPFSLHLGKFPNCAEMLTFSALSLSWFLTYCFSHNSVVRFVKYFHLKTSNFDNNQKRSPTWRSTTRRGQTTDYFCQLTTNAI